MSSHAFQAEHAPRGAEGSFDLGLVGSGGGFTLESGSCGDQDVFLGWFQGAKVHCWPYNRMGRQAMETGMGEFIPTGDPESSKHPPVEVEFISESAITRSFRWATDTWQCSRVRFSIATPCTGIPDPETVPAHRFQDAIAPALAASLSFDNRGFDTPMRGFFALGRLGAFRLMDDMSGGQMEGVWIRGDFGFATPAAPGVSGFSDMFMDFPFRRPVPNRNFCQGIGGILVEVPPGERRDLRIVLAWHRSGSPALGRDCRYAYTRFFPDLGSVASYGLNRHGQWMEEAEEADRSFLARGLSPARSFLLSKAVRSYWGSTQLLLEGSRFRWVVHEGACNMINTLDLCVDQAFYEAREHPWLLRNVLDTFASEYLYRDEVKLPGDPRRYPGGVSFTHDQGARGVFSRSGHSHYEATNHPDCFSFMTHEELLNWVLCAAVQHRHSGDQEWLLRHRALLLDCLQSMRHRDHPDPSRRNGIPGTDSWRCGNSQEITTYDSLDPSLGQTRNNVYMGVKCWAAYLALEWMLRATGRAEVEAAACAAREAADLAAGTIARAFDPGLGYIPAILEGGDRSAIIPVIEGLVYPWELGLGQALDPDGPYGPLLRVLAIHLSAVLRPGLCLFPDHGWKLSANNGNSWMSKIFICQHVAERVLGFAPDAEADLAHDHWWRVGCRRHSVIDQVVDGSSSGSGAIYPRCISAILWLA